MKKLLTFHATARSWLALLTLLGLFAERGLAQLLVYDDFEGYAPGTFPTAGGWELVYDGMGAASQTITAEHANSPTKSLQIYGAPGWSANAQRTFSSSSPVLGYEAFLLSAANVGSGMPSHIVGLIRKNGQ